ncbi:MAG: hypothetical protein ACQCN4_02560 [Candidatus Bathyarchaeia archaeon]|jgi:hypothetical protein
MKAKVKATGEIGEVQDFGEKFIPRYRVGERFYFDNELEFLEDSTLTSLLKEHVNTLRKEAVNAISKSEFSAKLLKLLDASAEAKEMTSDDLDVLYVDYFMSDLSFDEWFHQFSKGEL